MPTEFKIPMRETKTNLLPINQQQRIYILGVVQSPGYQVLLDIMESECVMQETKLLNTDAADDKAVLAEHKMAKAMWQFFVGVQKKIHYEINELNAPSELPGEPENEQ